MTFPPIAKSADLPQTPSNRRDLIALSIGYGLILLVIWTPHPWQRFLYWVTTAWILGATALSFEGWKTMGLRASGLLRSLWIVAVALLLAAAAVLLATRFHTLHPRRFHSPMFLRHYWAYAIWAMLQEFLLLDFVLLRLLRLLPGRKAAIAAAAGLFTLAHLPNPILMPVTLIWSCAACLLFLKYRNLYTLGLSHAILGICIAVTVPGRVDHNMRVGLGYLTYRPHHFHHRSQNDQTASTAACVIAEAPTRRS